MCKYTLATDALAHWPRAVDPLIVATLHGLAKVVGDAVFLDWGSRRNKRLYKLKRMELDLVTISSFWTLISLLPFSSHESML